MKQSNRLQKLFKISGIIFLFCAVADCLIGWMPEGGDKFLFGYGSTTLAEVPTWHYIVALPFGAVLAVLFMLIYGELRSISAAHLEIKSERSISVFIHCMGHIPLLMILIHTEFCLYMMFIKEALRAGLSAGEIEERFAFPILVTLVPPYVWEMIVCIIITVSLCRMIFRRAIPVRKSAVFCTPIVAKVILFAVFHLIYLWLPGLSFLDMATDSISWALACFMLAKALSNRANIAQE